jgi:CubicO group peptidase (beta-lactamase class C family)
VIRFIPLALCLSLAPVTFPQAAATHTQRMQQIIQNYVDNKSFMGAVLVAEKDEVLLSQGYGSADLEWGIANTPTTKFRIGSITKQFTAASILLLQEHGKIKLDEPLKTYLPDAPKTWDGVTVYNLLTHTSGIPNFTSVPGLNVYKLQDHTPVESIALIRDKPLDFEPGAKFYYSNSNYILLGQIIEKVSGLPYPEFLRQEILQPLGMTDTGVDSNASILPQRAQGYDSIPGGFTHADYISMTIPYSAGYLYSTVGDLLKWERGLFGGKVLSPASLRTMTTAKLGEYGTGVFIKDAAHHGVITHSGTIEGFDASLNFYPEKQLTIVVLGNVRTEAPDKIAEQLGKVAYDEKVVVNSDRKLVQVAPSRLADYAGHYSAPPFAITISVEGDSLTATTPGGRKYVLYPESETKFFLKEIDVQIEFIPDPATNNKVTKFMMTQDGNEKMVKRD